MKVLRLLVRIGLFLGVLFGGTSVAAVAGETRGVVVTGLERASIQALTVPSLEGVMYAASTGGSQPAGVYRSTDGGTSWRSVSSGPGVAVSALAIDPIAPSTIYAGTAGGPSSNTHNLWVSDNSGRTWRPLGLELPGASDGRLPEITCLLVSTENPDVLYVGTDGQGVYRYSLNRNGYRLLGGPSFYDAHVRALSEAGDGLFAVTNKGLFTFEGTGWQQIEAVPDSVVSFAASGTKAPRLYAGTVSSGLFRSVDNGVSWQSVTPAESLIAGAALRVTAMAVDRQDPFHVTMATAQGVGDRLAAGGIYESFDRGDNWTKTAALEQVASHLSVNAGAVYASGAGGLTVFGEPAVNHPARDTLNLAGRLLRPSRFQVLILVTTIVLAVVALMGRADWLPKPQQTGA